MEKKSLSQQTADRLYTMIVVERRLSPGEKLPSELDLSRELGVTTDYLLTGTPAEKERAELEGMLLGRIRAADQRLEQRRERPFSREELAVLFAAMLMEE